MSMDRDTANYEEARRDFQRARQGAALESFFAQLTGKSAQLLPFAEISEQLHAGEGTPQGLQQIPLDAIVGSVGRYGDFTRSFLPRRGSGEERWARVRAAFNAVEQMPPISVYRLGKSYFVLDGNHRVSVARMLGASQIAAYVTDVPLRVPLTPDMGPDQVICSAQYMEFLQDTRLDELRPEAELTVTAPGQYRILRGQIARHWAWLKQEQGEDVPFARAVSGWYDDIYGPLVQVIRRRGLLRHFPSRTETDLYAWMVRHRDELEQELGWEIDSAYAARDLVEEFSPRPQEMLTRVRQRMREAITPEPLEPGPPPGYWRGVLSEAGREHTLFAHILAPIDGSAAGWRALEQALVVAQRENSRVHGLHVISPRRNPPPAAIEALRAQFDAQCAAAGVVGEVVVERGRIAPTIGRRVSWNDLVVMPLSHPPGPRAGDRISSGLSRLIRGVGRPMLAVPGASSALQRPLLAFDGSPKAKEALFVAAYLAGKWRLPLTVVGAAVAESAEQEAAGALSSARQYLQSRRIDASYVVERGAVADVLQRVAEAEGSDWIIMGGYGFSPLLDVIFGSTVNDVLRWRRWPVLICR